MLFDLLFLFTEAWKDTKKNLDSSEYKSMPKALLMAHLPTEKLRFVLKLVETTAMNEDMFYLGQSVGCTMTISQK